MNGTKHVIIAMSLTALLFFIAGDGWRDQVSKIKPIEAAPK